MSKNTKNTKDESSKRKRTHAKNLNVSWGIADFDGQIHLSDSEQGSCDFHDSGSFLFHQKQNRNDVDKFKDDDGNLRTSSHETAQSLVPYISLMKQRTVDVNTHHHFDADSSTDAMLFHGRVEKAATIIQQNFRTRHLKNTEKDEEVEAATVNSSIQDEGQDDNSAEQEPPHDNSNLYTLAFVAVFGMGMFLFKVISGCISRSKDTGNEANVHVDGAQPSGAEGIAPPVQQP